MNTSNNRLSLARTIAGAFILIGSMIAIVGIIWLGNTASFVMRAAKASGTILEVERSTTSKGRSAYHPIFSFRDASGITHTQRTSTGSGYYSFERGENVTVLYDPSAPKNSKIDSFMTLWLGPLAITGFGLLYGGFSCFWLFWATRGIRLGQVEQA